METGAAIRLTVLALRLSTRQVAASGRIPRLWTAAYKVFSFSLQTQTHRSLSNMHVEPSGVPYSDLPE